MIKAVNILECPPAEVAFILWQWLQDEPFQIEGRLYVIPIDSEPPAHKLSVYWEDRTGTTYVEILCKATEVRVFDRDQGYWKFAEYDHMSKVFDVADPGRFEDLLAYLRWAIPMRGPVGPAC
jgi:hypothetical protein